LAAAAAEVLLGIVPRNSDGAGTGPEVEADALEVVFLGGISIKQGKI
jgi:hypothetical protein